MQWWLLWLQHTECTTTQVFPCPSFLHGLAYVFLARLGWGQWRDDSHSRTRTMEMHLSVSLPTCHEWCFGSSTSQSPFQNSQGLAKLNTFKRYTSAYLFCQCLSHVCKFFFPLTIHLFNIPFRSVRDLVYKTMSPSLRESKYSQTPHLKTPN